MTFPCDTLILHQPMNSEGMGKDIRDSEYLCEVDQLLRASLCIYKYYFPAIKAHKKLISVIFTVFGYSLTSPSLRNINCQTLTRNIFIFSSQSETNKQIHYNKCKHRNSNIFCHDVMMIKIRANIIVIFLHSI